MPKLCDKIDATKFPSTNHIVLQFGTSW